MNLEERLANEQLEAERDFLKCLLAAVLTDPLQKALDAVLPWFEPDWIRDPDFAAMATALIAEAKSPGPSDIRGVMAHNRQHGGNIHPAEFAKIACNGRDWVNPCHLLHYAMRLQELHRQRVLQIELANGASLVAEGQNPDTVIESIQETYTRYARNRHHNATDNRDALHRVMDKISGTLEEETVETGIGSLDDLIAITPTNLVVVAAEKGSGKSAFMLHVAMEALEVGTDVCFLSFEMSNEECLQRMAAWCSQVDTNRKTNPHVMDSQAEREAVYAAMNHLGKLDRESRLFLHVGDRRIQTVETTVKTFAATRDKPVLVVVDYLQLVDANLRGNVNREMEVNTVGRRLKALAMDTGCFLLTGSQVNEAGQVRESRSIEQHANILLHLSASEAQRAVSQVKFRITKNRSGALGLASGVWRKPINRFETLSMLTDHDVDANRHVQWDLGRAK